MTRRNTAMIALAVVLLLVGWYALLWSPRGAELAEAKANREAARARVVQLEARLDGLVQAAEERPRLEEEAELLGDAVPADAGMASMVLQVEEAARRTGVSFVSVVPTEPTAASTTGGPTPIPVTIDAKGGYFRLLDFLDVLAGMPRLVVVDTLNVQQVGAEDVQIGLAGRVFTTHVPVDPAAEQAAAAAPAPDAGAMDLG